MVVNLFKNKDLIDVDLKMNLKVDSKMILKIDF